MALKVLITDASVETASVNGKNGTFQSRRQKGMVKLPNGELRLIRIRLQGEKHYQPGEYLIGDSSYVVSQYGDLGLGTLELVPAAAVSAAARVV